MNDKAEKVYAEAFFELCRGDNAGLLPDYLSELNALDDIFAQSPDFIKVLAAPTVTMEEKLSIIGEIISKGNVSVLTGNLLCVLTERARMDCFSGIVKQFGALYNEYFGIAEIVVTSSLPLSDAQRKRIADKMSEITGKTVSIKEKVNPDIIGGVIIDCGGTRYDGSIRTRLSELKKELDGIIA